LTRPCKVHILVVGPGAGDKLQADHVEIWDEATFNAAIASGSGSAGGGSGAGGGGGGGSCQAGSASGLDSSIPLKIMLAHSYKAGQVTTSP
jgi:hypothetical protein